ncbi:hypothetical protein Agabi119p4_735 [Agaricus bisporus var. burnettii]|uniref:ATP-dependent DNA helicase n=1 Tax=Agaricus bisporus var. burnettii TaxID=192524 RepID=A0A8H7KL21_AGABI|nr:hypothetical protein Agabi119p4_735 [Agaricus bisporus var. burnettii]
MPKAKYYAVAVGRGAPTIFDSWAECSASVNRYSNALYHSFRTQQEAERWLASKSAATTVHMRPRHTSVKNDNTNTVKCHQPELKVLLSPEQHRIIARVKEGKNVFFTGSAGTGKSVLLREIIKLRRETSPDAVAVTASTGIAALNIGGVTLHSWAGIKLGDEPIERFVGKVRGQTMFHSLWMRWQEVKTLIIDEISMIDGPLFDYLEVIARKLRNSTQPFGGIQLVLCGDFCQLPPVPRKDMKGIPIPATFAFEAQAWNSCVGAPMMLTKVFRQKDETFSMMLNEMRYGRMQESTIQIFKSLSRSVLYTDGIGPTEIYPTRIEVNSSNSSRLRQLSD